MELKSFFDPATWTLTYLLYDPKTQDAAVVDPVLNFDQAASTTSPTSANEILAFLREMGLELKWILETHAHADHISGAQILKKAFPKARVGIGSQIREVQKTFAPIFGLEGQIAADGSQFDHLFADNEVIDVGALPIQVLFTPGHTPACCSFLVKGECLFTGDALFMPDSGTGRCAFPGGSAEALYDSIHGRIYQLPDSVRTFTGHDYQPNNRPLQFESTVGEHKRSNIHLKAETTKSDFVQFRTGRDKTLSAPKLLLPSIQLNINGGRLPDPDEKGRRFLQIPITPQIETVKK